MWSAGRHAVGKQCRASNLAFRTANPMAVHFQLIKTKETT